MLRICYYFDTIFFYSSRILLIHSISRNFQLVVVKTKRSETFFVYRHYLKFKNIPILKHIMELTHKNIKLRKETQENIILDKSNL